MNKEILEITKRFHETYEKLSKEYSYETREDTKVFNVNSNNGMLMYATVNEIVSPILKENQKLKDRDLIIAAELTKLQDENKILKENAENNDKVVDKVNWENQLLKKENKQLKDNWNKLKEWLVQLQKFKGINQQGFSWGVAQEVLDKMEEIEKNITI